MKETESLKINFEVFFHLDFFLHCQFTTVVTYSKHAFSPFGVLISVETTISAAKKLSISVLVEILYKLWFGGFLSAILCKMVQYSIGSTLSSCSGYTWLL